MTFMTLLELSQVSPCILTLHHTGEGLVALTLINYLLTLLAKTFAPDLGFSLEVKCTTEMLNTS